VSATAALPAATAEELLHPVLPAESVGEIVVRTGGELSTIFEVRLVGAGEPVVIKIYDDRWRWKQEKEAYVYHLLQQHGVGPVPAVLHQGDADNSWPLLHSDDDAQGAAVVRRQSRRRQGIAAGELREYAEHGGDAALATAIEAKVARQTELFGACRHAVLCHNAIHEGNVLVAEDGGEWQVSGLIDVENAIAADPLMDLAKTDYYSVHDDQDKREALCDGYGMLPADWSEWVGLYRLYHALELWDWFASIGNTAPLESITDDIRRMTA